MLPVKVRISAKSDGGSAFKKFSLRSLVRSSGDPLIELLAFFYFQRNSNPTYPAMASASASGSLATTATPSR